MGRALKEGASVNAVDGQGWSALHYSSASGQLEAQFLILGFCHFSVFFPMIFEVCKYLLNQSSDVNSTLHDFSTPLMLAVEEGHLDVAKLLLSNGAMPWCKDETGFTAKDRCDKSIQADLTQLLVSPGDYHRVETGPVKMDAEMIIQAAFPRGTNLAWVARRYAGLINGFWMLSGSLVFVQAISFFVQLQQQGHWSTFGEMARDAWQSYLLVLRLCISCFIEVKAEDVPEMSFEVWACFLPAFTSFFFCFTASLGLNVMRRPIPSLTLLYALCAATLLAFQAEFLEALGELRSIEDLQFQSEVVDSVKLFKESSNTFDYFWEKEGCMLMGDKLRHSSTAELGLDDIFWSNPS
eukprot:symbB.v1.2.019325.t1/scaffold1577.1/size110854/3